jgi:ketosteroid isomerase-like protein
MSENLDLVRSIFAKWEHGDFGSVAWSDPAIEFVLADGPAPRTWIGLDGMSAGWGDFLSVWKNWRGEAEEYRELAGDRVLVLIVGSGEGKASGLDAARVQSRGANVFHLVDGKVTRLVVYFNRQAALADLGLEE